MKGMLGGVRWDMSGGGGDDGEWKSEMECQERNLAVIIRKWE